MLSAKLSLTVRRLQVLLDTFLGRPPFPALDVALPSLTAANPSYKDSTFLESLKDSIVWAAVPKKRRSLAVRKTRWQSYHVMKPTFLRKDLVVCLHCGHHHEAHSLCGHCYEKIQAETKVIQDAMNITQRVPHDRDVVVLYEGEIADPVRTEKLKVVEVPKKRPLWFNPTLLTKVIEGKS